MPVVTEEDAWEPLSTVLRAWKPLVTELRHRERLFYSQNKMKRATGVV
jgi:hypothetical protein